MRVASSHGIGALLGPPRLLASLASRRPLAEASRGAGTVARCSASLASSEATSSSSSSPSRFSPLEERGRSASPPAFSFGRYHLHRVGVEKRRNLGTGEERGECGGVAVNGPPDPAEGKPAGAVVDSSSHPAGFPLWATGSMIASVAASNYLVQIPVSDWLTVASLSYPIAFLVTDVTNRLYGAEKARRVVYAGFAAGLPLSFAVSPFRIATASGTSFLVSQLLDVVIFDKLRRSAWWKAPLISTSISSAVDSYLFTFLAFYGDVTVHQSWAKLATGDYGIKITVAILSLLPFKVLVQKYALARSPG